MKRYNAVIAVVLVIIGFVCGVIAERNATNEMIDDIEQVAKEACDVRIKMIRETCKK